MKWDEISIAILAVFGCVMLLLAQVKEVLGKLPEIIRAWRQVRRELRDTDPPEDPAPGAATTGPSTE
ncbi:hypothetical protein [Streptomyces acidiscabies]|uniref:hypothetical protein n=1 Tax=Streptomyces acidiscabies TaxID=42234 RepID=UPI00076E6DBF|nr:hypothetical protein [Streptomyces acidiscabies]GAQ53635.1 hypothetical protein a10_03440 [Streptomyces acidiscabies]GAV41524.1 hypothetical protein Saa2_04429 [Streptomyces acidiscabies]